MTPDELFIRSLDDLHLSINSGDEYDVLQASAIIRKLFLDGDPLVDQINRNHKLKLQFSVIQPIDFRIDGIPEPDVWCAVDSIDPRRSPQLNPSTDLNRDPFLGLLIGRVQGEDYSVKDIISFVANVAGGVHAGSPKNAKDEALNKLKELYIFSDLSILLQHLRSIGRIILEALRPLRDKALNLERFQDSPGLSLHLVATLLPGEKGKELFIVDIGIEEQKDRLSIYLNKQQELCFRLIDSSGNPNVIIAGSHDCAFNFGEPTYLAFQVAFREKEVLMNLDFGGWSMVKIFPREQISLDPDKLFYVLGSDVTGQAHTHMHLMYWLGYAHYLKEEGSEYLRSHFEGQIRQGFQKSIYFKENEFLYSKDHPNFKNR
ncbi:MAG: hypothetical protein IH886_15165 [Nitrospinae bacterium]|nr:hypothetical protein [Nitrospinota bacterium]